MTKVVLAALCLFTLQAFGLAYTSNIDQDTTADAQASNRCADEDSLICYFSPAEIQSALGIPQSEALVHGMLTPDEEDQFADEDDDSDTSFDVASRGHISRGHHHYYRTRRSSRGGGVSVNISALGGMHSGEGAPVWGAFISALHACEPGCVPVNYNAYRHDSGSCHGQGRAIDVGGISCGGQTYYAGQGGRFAHLVECARGHMAHVMYEDAHCGKGVTKCHRNHGHFSMGCSVPGHRVYW